MAQGSRFEQSGFAGAFKSAICPLPAPEVTPRRDEGGFSLFPEIGFLHLLVFKQGGGLVG
jgi:hypothetical protein